MLYIVSENNFGGAAMYFDAETFKGFFTHNELSPFSEKRETVGDMLLRILWIISPPIWVLGVMAFISSIHFGK